MKKIRYGTFETNSSSTHAFGIVRFNRKGPVPDKIKFIDNIQFGWEQEIYDDPDSKFTYLIQAMSGMKYLDFSVATNLITNALKKAGVEEIIYPDIKVVGKGNITDPDAKVKIENLNVTVKEREDGFGTYIDHGDDLVYAFYNEDKIYPTHSFLRMVLTTEDKIQRFILGESWITTSNDNDGDGYLLPSSDIAYGEISGYYDEDDPEMSEFNKRFKELSDMYDIYFK